ncbi:MAG: hypothetical protein IPK19_41870, partial [Chloroflexi bacterium]|nr:hypothetical protein [Chloroflexota bacterium]
RDLHPDWRQSHKQIALAKDDYPHAEMIDFDNFYGQESRTAMQLRGGGTLVLLPDRTKSFFACW